MIHDTNCLSCLINPILTIPLLSVPCYSLGSESGVRDRWILTAHQLTTIPTSFGSCNMTMLFLMYT